MESCLQGWMLVSAIFLSVFSLGLSRINLIDYKCINEIILSRNINYTHLLQLPEAVCFERMNSENRRRATLWIAENKNKLVDAGPVVFVKHFGRCGTYNGEQISFDSLKEYFRRWDQNTLEDTKSEPCILYIHRDIKMNYVNRIKKCLAELQAYRIQYAVLPSVREYDDKYYTYLVFPLVTSRYFAEAEGWQKLQKTSNIPKHVHDLYTTHCCYRRELVCDCGSDCGMCSGRICSICFRENAVRQTIEQSERMAALCSHKGRKGTGRRYRSNQTAICI